MQLIRTNAEKLTSTAHASADHNMLCAGRPDRGASPFFRETKQTIPLLTRLRHGRARPGQPSRERPRAQVTLLGAQTRAGWMAASVGGHDGRGEW